MLANSLDINKALFKESREAIKCGQALNLFFFGDVSKSDIPGQNGQRTTKESFLTLLAMYLHPYISIF
jgi:hypothetical protein